MTRLDRSGDQLVRAAIAAYCRSDSMAQPSWASSNVATHGGRAYVVLNNCNGVLAVYRVKTNGVLRSMKRWPAVLNA